MYKGLWEMIKENNAMTFTNRLNYSVSEIPKKEFLAVLSEYAENKDNKKYAANIQSQLLKTG